MRSRRPVSPFQALEKSNGSYLDKITSLETALKAAETQKDVFESNKAKAGRPEHASSCDLTFCAIGLSPSPSPSPRQRRRLPSPRLTHVPVPAAVHPAGATGVAVVRGQG